MNIIPSTEINSEKMANRTNLMVQTDTDNNTHLHLLIARQKKLKLQCSNLWCNHMRYSKIAQGTDLKSTTLYYRERGRGGGGTVYINLCIDLAGIWVYILNRKVTQMVRMHVCTLSLYPISQYHSFTAVWTLFLTNISEWTLIEWVLIKVNLLNKLMRSACWMLWYNENIFFKGGGGIWKGNISLTYHCRYHLIVECYT